MNVSNFVRLPRRWNNCAMQQVPGERRFSAISWIRTRFMDTPFLQAAFQVVVGGVLVFIAGILIGSS
jgi:hypothetical protein